MTNTVITPIEPVKIIPYNCHGVSIQHLVPGTIVHFDGQAQLPREDDDEDPGPDLQYKGPAIISDVCYVAAKTRKPRKEIKAKHVERVNSINLTLLIPSNKPGVQATAIYAQARYVKEALDTDGDFLRSWDDTSCDEPIESASK